jgi:DNA ligase (NAD+)
MCIRDSNRHGHLAPTILVDRVAVGGLYIEKVTGHNAKYIYDEGIGPLALVRLRRTGDVIPIVDAVIGRADPAMPYGPDDIWTWTNDGLNVQIKDS